MAVFSPFGLISCDTRLSSTWNSKANQSYQINPADATPIYVGDPVTVVGGYVTKYTAANQFGGGGPVVPPLGVFLGCNYNQINATGYNVPFFRAWNGINDSVPGTPVYAVVEDDINTVFKIQIQANAGVTIAAGMYKNAQLVLPVQPAPNANPSQTSVVSLGAPAVGLATDDVKIVGIFDAANGGAYNANPTLNQWSVVGGVTCPNPILLVQWNSHITRAGTVGAP